MQRPCRFCFNNFLLEDVLSPCKCRDDHQFICQSCYDNNDETSCEFCFTEFLMDYPDDYSDVTDDYSDDYPDITDCDDDWHRDRPIEDDLMAIIAELDRTTPSMWSNPSIGLLPRYGQMWYPTTR